MKIRQLKRLFLGLGVLLPTLPSPALAYTQCTLTVSNIFSGDSGNVWIAFTNGGSGYLVAGDPDIQATTALAITALVGGRNVVVRYSADGVTCNATNRSDLIGLYLY